MGAEENMKLERHNHVHVHSVADVDDGGDHRGKWMMRTTMERAPPWMKWPQRMLLPLTSNQGDAQIDDDDDERERAQKEEATHYYVLTGVVVVGLSLRMMNSHETAVPLGNQGE